MCDLVTLQGACLREGLKTYVTAVGFLSTVSTIVANQDACLREGLRTDITDVWLFSCVCPFVALKVMLL